MAVMPWPRPPRPRSRQSKPSTRTAAGWKPKRARAHPAALRGDIGGAAWRGVGRTATGAGVDGATAHAGRGGQSMPNRLSWTTGLDDRRGGEPQNSGGCGDAAERLLSSPCHEPKQKHQRLVGEKLREKLMDLEAWRRKDLTFERRRSRRSMPASE